MLLLRLLLDEFRLALLFRLYLVFKLFDFADGRVGLFRLALKLGVDQLVVVHAGQSRVKL